MSTRCWIGTKQDVGSEWLVRQSLSDKKNFVKISEFIERNG